MSDPALNRRRLTWVVIGLLVLIGVLIRWQLRPNGPPPQPADGPNAEEMRRLFGLKNFANSSLENLPNDNTNDGSETARAFLELSEKLPGELLGVRNLVIARLLILFKQNADKDRPKAVLALHEAEAALETLRTIEGDTATVHLLAANLARLAVDVQLSSDKQRVIREYRKAARKSPDDSFVWGELYEFARGSDDADVRAVAPDALGHAYASRPDNLALLTEWLLHQAREKDPEIVGTLKRAKQVLGPYSAAIRRHGLDLLPWIDEAVTAASAGDEAGWRTVNAKVRPLVNVVKPELAYQKDLRSLRRFVLEYMIHDFSPQFYEKAKRPEPESPPAISVKLVPAAETEQLPQLAGVREALLADYDLDGRLDVIALSLDKVQVFGREPASGSWRLLAEIGLPAGMTGIQAVDLDRDMNENPAHKPNQVTQAMKKENGADDKVDRKQLAGACEDADVDLIVYGSPGIRILQNKFDKATSKRSLEIVRQEAGGPGELKNVLAAGIADLDHDGDLDLVISTQLGVSLWSNRENFTFEDISARSALPPVELQATAILPVDWDRNVGIDLVLAGPSADKAGLLENMQHGRFRWREFGAEFNKLGGGAGSLALADVDQNVSWDLLAGGKDGITLLQTRTPESGLVRFLKTETVANLPVTDLKTWDFDNDGFLDLVAWGEKGIAIYRGTSRGNFRRVTDIVDSRPTEVRSCDVGDLDGDGDWDLLAVEPERLTWFRNEGGDQNHWIDVALSAERDPQNPSHRCNLHGVGSLLELKAGSVYQPQVVTRQTSHFGLGRLKRADVLRVLWTNGIPQSELRPETNQAVCQEQRLLKGSCPYLYTWTGTKYEFFTDLLWAAPLGLQKAEGVLAPAREWEYLKIPGDRLIAWQGEYRLQVTEELWEAGYFDTLKLLAVDHPGDVDIYSNEKVGPAEIAGFGIHTVRSPRSPVAARDQRGHDVLAAIARRDGTYLKTFDRRFKQGLTEEHFVELDLGDLQDPQQITLYLTGWTFPTDTSLNVAISQNPRVDAPRPPAVWVPDAQGRFRQAIPYMGFPGGKTKTIAVDLSNVFLTEDYRVRIVTTMEIYWDAVFFTVDEPAAQYKLTELPLVAADLHGRGFSRRIGHPGFGPESYDYEQVTREPLWPPMTGRFTRYGDVTELVGAADDRLVVLGAGDEMTLRFEAPADVGPAGWTRDFILHSVGWDKDADWNTLLGQTVEPLPFRKMSRYPYGPDETYPDTPRQREYLRKYQTRRQDTGAFWRQIHRFRAVTSTRSGRPRG